MSKSKLLKENLGFGVGNYVDKPLTSPPVPFQIIENQRGPGVSIRTVDGDATKYVGNETLTNLITSQSHLWPVGWNRTVVDESKKRVLLIHLARAIPDLELPSEAGSITIAHLMAEISHSPLISIMLRLLEDRFMGDIAAKTVDIFVECRLNVEGQKKADQPSITLGYNDTDPNAFNDKFRAWLEESLFPRVQKEAESIFPDVFEGSANTTAHLSFLALYFSTVWTVSMMDVLSSYNMFRDLNLSMFYTKAVSIERKTLTKQNLANELLSYFLIDALIKIDATFRSRIAVKFAEHFATVSKMDKRAVVAITNFKAAIMSHVQSIDISKDGLTSVEIARSRQLIKSLPALFAFKYASEALEGFEGLRNRNVDDMFSSQLVKGLLQKLSPVFDNDWFFEQFVLNAKDTDFIDSFSALDQLTSKSDDNQLILNAADKLSLMLADTSFKKGWSTQPAVLGKVPYNYKIINARSSHGDTLPGTIKVSVNKYRTFPGLPVSVLSQSTAKEKWGSHGTKIANLSVHPLLEKSWLTFPITEELSRQVAALKYYGESAGSGYMNDFIMSGEITMDYTNFSGDDISVLRILNPVVNSKSSLIRRYFGFTKNYIIRRTMDKLADKAVLSASDSIPECILKMENSGVVLSAFKFLKEVAQSWVHAFTSTSFIYKFADPDAKILDSRDALTPSWGTVFTTCPIYACSLLNAFEELGTDLPVDQVAELGSELPIEVGSHDSSISLEDRTTLVLSSDFRDYGMSVLDRSSVFPAMANSSVKAKTLMLNENLDILPLSFLPMPDLDSFTARERGCFVDIRLNKRFEDFLNGSSSFVKLLTQSPLIVTNIAAPEVEAVKHLLEQHSHTSAHRKRLMSAFETLTRADATHSTSLEFRQNPRKWVEKNVKTAGRATNLLSKSQKEGHRDLVIQELGDLIRNAEYLKENSSLVARDRIIHFGVKIWNQLIRESQMFGPQLASRWDWFAQEFQSVYGMPVYEKPKAFDLAAMESNLAMSLSNFMLYIPLWYANVVSSFSRNDEIGRLMSALVEDLYDYDFSDGNGWFRLNSTHCPIQVSLSLNGQAVCTFRAQYSGIEGIRPVAIDRFLV